jgi:hypothetical protein
MLGWDGGRFEKRLAGTRRNAPRSPATQTFRIAEENANKLSGGDAYRVKRIDKPQDLQIPIRTVIGIRAVRAYCSGLDAKRKKSA